MRSVSFPPPIILPAARGDIPELVRIYIDAERPDVLFRTQNPSPEKLAKQMIQILDESFDAPELLIMKAVDSETGAVTAMAIWELRGYDLKKSEAKDSGSGAKSTLFSPLHLRAGLFSEKSRKGALSEYLDAQFDVFFESWMKGIKCLYLGLLMTDPRYQRRGIGTAMLDYGHRRADHDQVPSILVASPFGHPLYQSLGWKDISLPLRVDLKDWVRYAETGDKGYGPYSFYYMLRLPHKVSESARNNEGATPSAPCSDSSSKFAVAG